MELCEICHLNEATQWDHDHVSGKIRGRLCQRCNTALGCFEDDVPRLRNAITYLERPLTDRDFADYKREYQRLAMQKWRAEHREQDRANKKKLYANDPERMREYSRRWRRDDADGAKKRQQAENLRKWFAEHPEKRDEYNANRRAKRRKD